MYALSGGPAWGGLTMDLPVLEVHLVMCVGILAGAVVKVGAFDGR